MWSALIYNFAFALERKENYMIDMAYEGREWALKWALKGKKYLNKIENKARAARGFSSDIDTI